MNDICRKCGRLFPALGLALGLAACASAPQEPVVNADSILRVANLTRSEGDLTSAAGLYQRAHELDPTDVRPLIELGHTLARMGSAGAAADSYRAALQLDASNAEALRGLGLALLNSGEPDAAIKQFEKALDRGKDYRLYNSIGVAYDMLGDHASAQTYYQSALQLAPRNLDVTNNLGLSLALEGRYQDAIPLLEQAASDPMATARFRQNLAFAYGLAGQRDRARQLAERDLDPATVERNMAYFDVLKGLKDDRTMASALGAHLADSNPAGTQPNGATDTLPQAGETPVPVPAPKPGPVSELTPAGPAQAPAISSAGNGNDETVSSADQGAAADQAIGAGQDAAPGEPSADARPAAGQTPGADDTVAASLPLGAQIAPLDAAADYSRFYSSNR